MPLRFRFLRHEACATTFAPRMNSALTLVTAPHSYVNCFIENRDHRVGLATCISQDTVRKDLRPLLWAGLGPEAEDMLNPQTSFLVEPIFAAGSLQVNWLLCRRSGTSPELLPSEKGEIFVPKSWLTVERDARGLEALRCTGVIALHRRVSVMPS